MTSASIQPSQFWIKVIPKRNQSLVEDIDIIQRQFTSIDQISNQSKITNPKLPLEVQHDIIERKALDVIVIELEQVQPFIHSDYHTVSIAVHNSVIDLIQEFIPEIALVQCNRIDLSSIVDRIQFPSLCLLEEFTDSFCIVIMRIVVDTHGSIDFIPGIQIVSFWHLFTNLH